jgi:hypothetical protein
MDGLCQGHGDELSLSDEIERHAKTLDGIKRVCLSFLIPISITDTPVVRNVTVMYFSCSNNLLLSIVMPI